MRRLLLKLLRRRRLEEDLESELAFHREQSAARGNPVPLGSTLRIKEEARDLWRFTLLEDLWRDLRYGARSLLRQPAFTGFAILALVVGIGLNVVVFSAFSAMALRPWPVRDPGRVVIVRGDTFSLNDYRHIRDHARSFEGVAFVSPMHPVSVDGQNQSIGAVSANYFDLLGVPMAFGRPFSEAEGRSDAQEPVAVLTYTFWKSHHGGDPGILGRQVRLNGIPFTVIGVAGQEMTGVFEQVWVPAAARALLDPDDHDQILSPDSRCCHLVARLAKGVGRATAEAELVVLARQMDRPERRTDPSRRVTVIGTRLIDSAGWGLVSFYFIAQITVGAIFLLACANVGNLVLARAITRDRELAIRMSLGAGRSRIVRQLVTEGVLLAFAASAVTLGVMSAWAQLVRLRGNTVSVDESTGAVVTSVGPVVDLGVVAYAAGVAALATLVCGLAPALQATRMSLMDAMKRQSAQATPRVPLRGVLLGVQVAISVTVLVCAALLLRGVQRVSNTDVGFRSHGVSSVSVQLHWKDFFDRGAGATVDRLRDELRPFGPVGLSVHPPFGISRQTRVVLPARGGRTQEVAVVDEAFVDGGYFEVLEIPVVAGRGLEPADRGREIVLVNEAMARRHWPGESPLGRTLRVPVQRNSGQAVGDSASVEREHEIVGVVRDANLKGPGTVAPTLFRVHAEADQNFTLLVPERSAGLAAAAVARIDQRATVSVQKLGDHLDAVIGAARVLATLASVLGLIALLLASTGVYGVIAYAVEGRRREIGIRMALGARARTVVHLIIGRHARALLTGLAAGLGLSMLVSKVLESSLYGVSRLDPMAYAGVLLVLLAAGIAASALPARRAARIDPVKVLQAD